MKLSFKDLLATIGKKGSYDILLLLKDSPKSWSILEEAVKDKRAVSFRIRELISLGLIKVVILQNKPLGSKAYELTPLGKKVVNILERMKKEFDKYNRQ